MNEELEPRYPEIEVLLDIDGPDGNAHVILGHVTNAMKQHCLDKIEIDTFLDEATSGDYQHLLATCKKWVDFQEGMLVSKKYLEETDFGLV